MGAVALLDNAPSFALLAAVTSVLAYGLPRGRYAVLPGLVVLLMLLAGAWDEEDRRRRTCRTLVGVKAAERRIAIDGLPADFKVLIRGTSRFASRRLLFELLLQDAAGATLAAVPLSGLRPGEPSTIHLTAAHVRPRPGRDLGATRFLVLRAASRDGTTAVADVERITIAPRVEGLLDELLPARTLPCWSPPRSKTRSPSSAGTR